jgi:type IV fimbrial biogenesis protein FimT
MHRQRTAGFTLIEMLVAIAIAAILLAVAVPSFSAANLSSRLRATSTDLIASASLARAEAIKRNGIVHLCPSADGTSCTSGGWEQGWIVIAPAKGTLAEKIVRRSDALPAGFKVTSSGGVAIVSFQPTGVGATAVTFTICRATPSVGNQERVVTIDATGRTASRKTATGICS